ncbi:IF2 family translation initiation factor [Mycobacterium sp. DSM 3803]|nr:IF2 family translation initiation factor [Mycobacterium sp. DSM 3803]
MRVTEIPSAVLRLQYRIARFPLQLIDAHVVSRLDSEAPARLLYENSLGTLDAKIGGVLGDTELEQRGTALSERSKALARAAQLDAMGTEEIEHADADLEAVRDDAIVDVREAREAKNRRAADARATAEERKKTATQRVQNQTEAAMRQADQTAAHRKASAEAARRDERAGIEAAEERSIAEDEAKLDDAAQARSSAAGYRAQADRLEELADAKKRQRRAERADDA